MQAIAPTESDLAIRDASADLVIWICLQVLAHPQFQQDPIAAVAEHLKATLPPEEAAKKPRKNVSGSQKQKLKRQKARLESEMDS